MCWESICGSCSWRFLFGNPEENHRDSFNFYEIRRYRGEFDADYEDENGKIIYRPASKYFLALGDSLTEGYYDMGREFHPFTEQLGQLLRKNGYGSIGIVNRGISGEKTDQMIERLQNTLRYSPVKYDFVSILGGTNDLGYAAETVESIYSRLETLYNAVLSTKAKLIVVTIPVTSFDKETPDYQQKKNEINARILRFYEEKKGSGRVELIDLYHLIPYDESAGDGQGSSLWDDELHLSPAGYDKLGEFVYEKLLLLLK